jgi:hypothetical protein
MDIDGVFLKRIDAGGVWPLLMMVSGYAAMERGSEFIEPRDLIKGIYVVDLEHVSIFWSDWEGFEKFVTSGKLGNGASESYINRTLYLVRLEMMSRDHPGQFIGVGKPSSALKEIVATARAFASERVGAPSTPSSRDLLFSACSQDSDLSAALQESGLQLEKLVAWVRNSKS